MSLETSTQDREGTAPSALASPDQRSSRRAVTRTTVLTVVILLAGLALPYVLTNRYYMSLSVAAMILAFHALAVGFLARHLGLISLGHVAFFGGSAYCMGIAMTHWGWSPMMAAIFAFVAGAVAAILMGALIIRFSGMGFLMLTLALGQALYTISIQPVARDITGAYDGLQLSAAPDATFLGVSFSSLMAPATFWPFAWVTLILVIYGLWWVGRSRFGSLLEGIRENEERMRFSGIDTFWPRLTAFTISGAVASLGGVLFALNGQYVSPQVLGFLEAGNALIAAIIGGLGALLGPVVGAVIYTFGHSFMNYGGNLQLFMGALLVIVLVFFRGGLAGLAQPIMTRLKKRRKKEGTE